MTYYGEQHNKYQRARMRARRKAWIEAHGPCQRCGSKGRLEIDHINRAEKEYAISQIWQRPKLLEVELAKCQVLCHDCHRTKTSYEMFLTRTHGLAGYRKGCRCTTCKTIKSKSRREHYLKTGK